jgi:hypothetical protein
MLSCARGMDQAVEHLPGKHEALSSNPKKKNQGCPVIIFVFVLPGVN